MTKLCLKNTYETLTTSLIDQAKTYSSKLKPLFDKKKVSHKPSLYKAKTTSSVFFQSKTSKDQHVAYLISSSRDNLLGTLLQNYATYFILIIVVSLFYIWNIYSEFTHKKELTYLSSTDFLTKLSNREIPLLKTYSLNMLSRKALTRHSA